ncbi:MAG TPA: N-acetyl-1-D-myo-inositol-2-amino-2-deoxy-alpha-D-glucopyranoside deacetylase [Streptosporangiaceae bacterium]|nr:N-acetyl-1-D-myo-inositol-2-amino-2-deoxy-alpha-D-glucopyranoside deacetylase [Streptosporangiaceae bacterium]
MSRGLLLVHAHPDDESIGTGATMARYAAAGARVTLVTCTRGELGEVIPPPLAHLADGDGARLGEYRAGELAAACAALGVTDRRFLGGPGRWRDSGMMGTDGNGDPRCFWRADPDEAAAALLEVIREVRPQVLVSYDANGGYGHPDHIQAHRVAGRAFRRAGQLGLGLAKLYAIASPEAGEAAEAREAAEAGVTGETGRPAVTAEAREVREARETAGAARAAGPARATTRIDAEAWLGAKLAAMRAHATQITVTPPYFALSDGARRLARGTEYYTLLAGPRGPAGPDGRETDLFAGTK